MNKDIFDPKGQQNELYSPAGLVGKFLPAQGEDTMGRRSCWRRADASVHRHTVCGHESLALSSDEEGKDRELTMSSDPTDGGGQSSALEGWLGRLPFLATSSMCIWAVVILFSLLIPGKMINVDDDVLTSALYQALR